MGPRAGLLVAGWVAAIWMCSCGGHSPRRSHSPGAESDVGAAAANPVTVSPLPGTTDASATTQISFLGLRGTRVADVQVLGSHSGPHAGVLRAYSTGTGESFLPAKPFLPGERVTVRARVGRGVPRRIAQSAFTVARQAPVSEAEFPASPGDAQAVQHYSTAPELTPSTVTVTTNAGRGLSPGYFFLAPYQGSGSPGPMIVDQSGALVWFHPLPAGQEATNFSVQRYQGRPALSWWQGRIIEAGFGQGEEVIYDSSYRRVATVRGGNGYQADLHAVHLTPQGTAWIDAFDPIQSDLSSVGGAAKGILTDSVVQEIDIETGLVMWEWHALGHIPLGESNAAVAQGGYPWDYAHVNSVDPGTAGDVLLSARSTWALYDVEIHSGRVRWRLGGKRSSFSQPSGAHFYWQHDARFQPDGRISLFDNGSEPPEEKQSRGLVLALHPASSSVSLVKELVNPASTLLSASQGSMAALSGGNWLLGYGRLPNFTEFDAAGHVLLDATLGRNVQDFSVAQSPWSGRPRTPPALLARRGRGGRLTVSVSWNGDTEVASWRLLAGRSPQTLAPVADAPRRGFQTDIATRAGGSYVAVQALDGAGRLIAASVAVRA
jgi:hypothetical protein